MLSVRQARTLLRRLSGKDGKQGQLQALIEDREQALIKERTQAQAQAQRRAKIEEEGRPQQQGPSDS
jgi:hypothetical protein